MVLFELPGLALLTLGFVFIKCGWSINADGIKLDDFPSSILKGFQNFSGPGVINSDGKNEEEDACDFAEIPDGVFSEGGEFGGFHPSGGSSLGGTSSTSNNKSGSGAIFIASSKFLDSSSSSKSSIPSGLSTRNMASSASSIPSTSPLASSWRTSVVLSESVAPSFLGILLWIGWDLSLGRGIFLKKKIFLIVYGWLAF